MRVGPKRVLSQPCCYCRAEFYQSSLIRRKVSAIETKRKRAIAFAVVNLLYPCQHSLDLWQLITNSLGHPLRVPRQYKNGAPFGVGVGYLPQTIKKGTPFCDEQHEIYRHGRAQREYFDRGRKCERWLWIRMFAKS